jgi:hypothetical protein
MVSHYRAARRKQSLADHHGWASTGKHSLTNCVVVTVTQ